MDQQILNTFHKILDFLDQLKSKFTNLIIMCYTRQSVIGIKRGILFASMS